MSTVRWLLSMTIALSIAGLLAAEPTPWERYLLQPSPENAKRVSQIAYSQAQAESDQVERDLMLLGVQVGAADAESTRLAFRLRSSADGHLGETLDIMLGRLIRFNPRLFLSILREQGRTVERMDSLVGNFGDEYVDRDSARRYEASRRRAALLTINDRALVSVRNECLAALNDESR